MTDLKDVIKQGEIILREKSGILKQKHKRWCVLCRNKERFTSLEFYEKQDQLDKLKTSYTLTDVKNIDKVVKESSKDFYIDVYTKKDKFSLIFSNQADTESWFNCLHEYSSFWEGREDSSNTGDNSEQSGLIDNVLYDSQPDETARFDVRLKLNSDVERLQLHSHYRLHVSNVCLMLEDLDTQEPKFKWYYENLRKYGKQGSDFIIIAGRRSESGEGTFVFIHDNPSSITKAIDKLTKRKHNEQLTSKLNFPDSEKQTSNRTSEPLPQRDESPVPERASSLKDKEESLSKQPLTRQHSAQFSSDFKHELEETVQKSKTFSEKSFKSKKEKHDSKDEKKKGFGFFKSKDKKSKEDKNNEADIKDHQGYQKEHLYDEPELSPEVKKPVEPIYEEADQNVGHARDHKVVNEKVPLKPNDQNLYAQANPNRQHAWKKQGLQEEEHLENYDSIKEAAASQKSQQKSLSKKEDSEDIDYLYDHGFQGTKYKNRTKNSEDPKNVYGFSSGRELKVEEGDYELGDDDFAEYDDALSTQNSRKEYRPQLDAYEDVEIH